MAHPSNKISAMLIHSGLIDRVAIALLILIVSLSALFNLVVESISTSGPYPNLESVGVVSARSISTVCRISD